MRKATYFGVFLIAMATLITEVLLTRITSVVAWYHLAFFVISLAMLGMTAGAVIVFVLPTWFRDKDVTRRLAQGSGLLAAIMPVGVWAALQIPLEPITNASSFAATLGYGAALAIPFTVSGVVLTLALTRAALPPGIVYGVDLVGAAAGCLVVIPLLNLVDAPSGVLAASGIAALSGYAFARGEPKAVPQSLQRGLLGLAVFLGAVSLFNAATDGSVIYPRYVKGTQDDRSAHAFRDWNTYSRVTVDHTIEAPPALWAPSRTLPPELDQPIPQRFVKIDGAAGTMMASLDTDPNDDVPGTPSQHAYLAWDVTSFAHLLRPDGPAAVIGVGGGRDVLEAVRVGHSEVVGIELNDLIVHLHEGPMRAFSGIADLEGVTLINDEARSFMSRDRRRYNVITMSLIDTWAATGAGAYALSENGLYTVEGWQIFLKRLKPSGIFTVSRWYKPKSPGETTPHARPGHGTLWSLGVKEPRKHLVLLQNQSIATLLVAAKPFSPPDIDRLQREAVKRGYNMLLTPRRLPSNPMIRELAEIEDRQTLWTWAKSQSLDFTPPTDERPFFFNMLRPGRMVGAGARRSPNSTTPFLGNLYATQTLIYATLASAVLTLFAVVIPLMWRRRELSGYSVIDVVSACMYFALIGLGFMFVEMGLLSRLNVFIGHPTLALASLLGGIIFFTAWAACFRGGSRSRKPTFARLYPLLPATLVLLVALSIDPVMGSMAAASTPMRVLVGIAIVGVPALAWAWDFRLGFAWSAGSPATDDPIWALGCGASTEPAGLWQAGSP